MNVVTRSWYALSGALVACVLVWLAIWALEQMQTAQVVAQERARSVQEHAQEIERLRALARDTEATRAALNSLAGIDVVSLVERVEAAGADAGASIKIKNASPELSTSSPLRAVTLHIESNGEFSTLMREIALLETLPVPSVFDAIRLERASGGWRMDARLRLFTNAPL